MLFVFLSQRKGYSSLKLLSSAAMSLINLPLEILANIFKFLSLSDLRSLMLTSKSLRILILENNSLWKSVCRNRMIVYNKPDNCKYKTFSSYNLFRISNNWCSGIYRSKIIIQHHTNYMPWLTYNNSEALLLSVGSELHCFPTDRKGIPLCKETLWRFEVPKVKRNDVRTNDISRFIMKKNLLVCGNRDGCTAVFKVENIKQKPHLLYHIEDCHENGLAEVSTVEAIMGLETSCAITGSIYSSNLLFWHFNTGGFSSSNEIDDMVVRDIKLSDDVGIRCLCLDDNNEKLAIGLNGNSKPLLLDINKGKMIMTADTTKDARQTIRDIRWHNQNTIMLVTHSGNLQLIDTRTQEVVYDMMDPFQSTLYCVKSDGDRSILVGTSEYSRCVLFDPRNNSSHVQMYFTQKKSSPIYSLDFDSTLLIAAADRSIAALNFNINASSTSQRDYSQKFEFVNR